MSEAERLLSEHFGQSPPVYAPHRLSSAASGLGAEGKKAAGELTELEAERILAAHFRS